MFKQIAVAASFSAIAIAANAAGIVVGGGIQVATGTIVGGVTSGSTGSVSAGTEVIGSGKSVQSTNARSGGAASVTGGTDFNGSNVQTSTSQFATVSSTGFNSGNTPLVASNGSIINGTTGFASSDNNAQGAATFQKVGIEGVAGLGIHGF